MTGLWLAVERRGLDARNLTPEQIERISVKRNQLGTRARRLFARGPLVCVSPSNYHQRHVCPGPDSHGIIRAGVRVR